MRSQTIHGLVFVAGMAALSGSGRAAQPAQQPPAIARILASGASVDAHGVEHGLKTYLARGKDHFMVFDVTPDGQAIVSGLLMQMSLQDLLATAGSRATELSRAHGLRTVFLRTGDRFQVFYATPDEQRVIPGTMWDATGRNVTRQQVASVPGTVPTVEIGGPDQATSGGTTASSGSASLLQQLSATSSAVYGPSGAPSAWMFIDPLCSVCARAMQRLKPAIQAGKLRLAVIPLSILDPKDNGLSTQRALAMVGKPSAALGAWESGESSGEPAADAAARLQINMNVANTLQIEGTPTFVWRRPDGSIGRLNGLPPNPEALITAIEA